MIQLDDDVTQQVNYHLTHEVVDARLEMVSRLGAAIVGRFVPSAGSIRWDGTQRRGQLDVDLVTGEPVMHDRHPAGTVGQALEVWWTWPMIGVSVPCGWWLIAEAEHAGGGVWRISADPEGPARLDRARWWQPGGALTQGTLGAQLGGMMNQAAVSWTPASNFREWRVPATKCEMGATILSTVEDLIGQAGAVLRPDRHSRGVLVGSPQPVRDVDWDWDATQIATIEGTLKAGVVPNRVTVWRELDTNGKRTTVGWSEALHSGPRRWGGPYGRVPAVIKLDGHAASESMRDQARRELMRGVAEASTLRMTLRADPRIEVGDVAHVAADDTDCTGTVASVELNAASGMASVELAVASGVIAGRPVNETNP